MLNRLFFSCSSWLLEGDLFFCVLALAPYQPHRSGNCSKKNIYAPKKGTFKIGYVVLEAASWPNLREGTLETLDQLFLSGPQYVITKLRIMALPLDLREDILRVSKLRIKECKEFAFTWPKVTQVNAHFSMIFSILWCYSHMTTFLFEVNNYETNSILTTQYLLHFHCLQHFNSTHILSLLEVNLVFYSFTCPWTCMHVSD